ncbi:hypothetical protein [Foetidibacter luteolus]|uniref:hypothetical protein n=1 Tax=Foetidibacter luteolus TaxID=2608880 RepID=UPI00129A5E4E|nr:hypothetical protein [Foetidibacter luteolus]
MSAKKQLRKKIRFQNFHFSKIDCVKPQVLCPPKAAANNKRNLQSFSPQKKQVSGEADFVNLKAAAKKIKNCCWSLQTMRQLVFVCPQCPT